MISSICYWISKVPQDKLLHFIIAYLIVDISTSVCCHFSLDNWIGLVIGASIALLATIIKELDDKRQWDDWSWLDILASCVGIVVNVSLYLIQVL